MKPLIQRLFERFKTRLKKYGRRDKRTLELKALLNKARNNWNPTPDFNRQMKREYNNMRLMRGGAPALAYSSTIHYEQVSRSLKNNFRLVQAGELKVNERLTEHQARVRIAEYEDELNQRESGAQYTLAFQSLQTNRILRGGRLEKSKMFKCNYSVYNKYVSEWTDSGVS